MEQQRQMQSVHSPSLKTVSGSQGNLHNLYAENPGALAPDDSRFATRSVFDCRTLLRSSLVRSITVSGGTLTSLDHYAEGPGEFTWWSVWRM
jgi:hypothetical protein